jgi:hypothetical protein
MTTVRLLCFAAVLLSGCAVQDSRIAEAAQSRLLGLSEVDLESCLGAPDQHSSFGGTDVLTYYATSTSTTSVAVPVIGGLSLGNGGYCHATVQVKDNQVTQILYSGEKNATLAPSAYCAPIFRTCMDHLQRSQPARTASAAMPADGRSSAAP